MNRLIILGNGFDLAHELPTKYEDFINHYWSSIKDSAYADDFVSFKNKNHGFDNCYTMIDILQNLQNSNLYARPNIVRGNLNYVSHNQNQKAIIYNNSFFEHVCGKYGETNWVDIENEYYSKLKTIANSKTEEDESKVKLLNKHFESLKNKFNEYLNCQVLNLVSNKKYKKLADILNPIQIYDEYSLDQFLTEFSAKTVKEIKKEIQLATTSSQSSHSLYSLKKTFVLNFNYTKTIDNYYDDLGKDYEIVYIHGQADSTINPINFGFGDEMDDSYKAIENKNNNEYLKFIKSFAYSNNSGYNKFLNFIEADKFQVHILGHSCGISDRVLLNTIFEHDNCRSIKVFFHKHKNDFDNYTELVQNISRQFEKKVNAR